MKLSASIGLISASIVALSSTVQASFLDKPAVATYWGQNSAGGQLPLASYCDSNSDVIIVGFVDIFSNGNLPDLNLSDACGYPFFPGTTLLSCPVVGSDIQTCQSQGKTILMSLGGSGGIYGFADDADAEALADTLWNIYGGGSSDTRPFGDAVVDGFDLDIEAGGSTGYTALVNRLRTHFATDTSKTYYITAAPQCPYPDAMLGPALDASDVDAVFVQFYNNQCTATSSMFNFATWDAWAKNTSPNNNAKVFLGIPGALKAAPSGGYVPFAQLPAIVDNIYETYSSFGGIMLWDASFAYANTDVSPNYETAVADLIHGLSGGAPAAPTTTVPAYNPPTTTKSPKTTKTPKAKTTTTTTTTTAITAAPTGTSGAPGSCPVNNGPCPTDGAFACAGTSFAQCSNNAWVVRACSGGTTCFSTTDGSSIYCGQGSSSTCPASATDRALSLLNKKPTVHLIPTAKPFKSAYVTAEILVNKATPSSFVAAINARRLDTKSFGKTVTIQFKVANNVKVTAVENGTVAQKGSNVKIEVKTDAAKTNAIIVSFSGEVTSGIFVTPSVDTMSFA